MLSQEAAIKSQHGLGLLLIQQKLRSAIVMLLRRMAECCHHCSSTKEDSVC
jgi:hypothetical protein